MACLTTDIKRTDGTGVMDFAYCADDRIETVDGPLPNDAITYQYDDVASYAYDPFGRLMSKSGTLDQPYTFSTKEYDSRTGFNYYGYRFYDSCSGKWTTRDPLEETGGVNLYQFNNNSAMNWIDPKGLIPLDTIWDLGNIVYDAITGDWESFALDSGALFIPYVPAGITKIGKIGKAVRTCKIAKAESKFWAALDNYKDGLKSSGSGKKKRYYDWDHTHGDIEYYDRHGDHLGSLDPTTGLQTKPAVPGRDIRKRL